MSRSFNGPLPERAAEPWIWLPEDKYPQRQRTKLSCMANTGDENYTVAQFCRRYDFGGREILKAELAVSGDTAFLLFANGLPAARGPAGVGGDFLYNDVLRPEYYALHVTLTRENCPGLRNGELNLCAIVRMGSVRINEYSRGAGGFLLLGRVFFADGGEADISSDETWSARLLSDYTAPYRYHGGAPAYEALPAQKKTPPVKTLLAPIPVCDERPLPLENGGLITLNGETEKTAVYGLDRTYACYVNVFAKTDVPVRVQITGYELPGGADWYYELQFTEDAAYYGMELQSVGGIRVETENAAAGKCELRVELRASCYPITQTAKTETSDPDLNLVLEVCAHSLKYCRQTHHLDSPKHCEPLACTGDYYIETLMTAFTFGDLRLAAFDIRRTANLLRQHGGEMFHTSYSLIWVLMLWDVYRLTGQKELLAENADALKLLLDRFSGYVGENGLIETPPNYMFIDWLTPDGISLHHPPKALGQTCLCMFCYGALKTAGKIYAALGDGEKAADAEKRAEALRAAIYALLWDGEKQLFFEGLNTPTEEALLNEWMPQNVPKRYYRLHANILAAYFGFFDRETNRALLRRIIFNDALGPAQPYFQHFLLDAVYRNGLREEYTLPLLTQWKAPVKECPMGLPEGFYKPEPGYRFDRSHAWAGSPAYALPLAVSGLKILEPGYKKISLAPSSLGLESVRVEIPTPCGKITVRAGKGKRAEVTVPKGIEAVIAE